MAVTKLKRKKMRRRRDLKLRTKSFKDLMRRPVIKKVDVEEIKKNF